MTDFDNDGYGDETQSQGSIPGSDCNDNEPSINPGAAEIQDGLEQIVMVL